MEWDAIEKDVDDAMQGLEEFMDFQPSQNKSR
jgi:hypothetical protein